MSQRSWGEIQEWVELESGKRADWIERHAEQAVVRTIEANLDLAFERDPELAELDDNERLAIRAGLRWKTFQRLSCWATDKEIGWAEAYFADLKRMFEEEGGSERDGTGTEGRASEQEDR